MRKPEESTTRLGSSTPTCSRTSDTTRRSGSSSTRRTRPRAIPDVEQQWYQAPGGDYRADLYDGRYPGSVPETVARHLFTDGAATTPSSTPHPRQHRGLPAEQPHLRRDQRLVGGPLARFRRDTRFLGTIRVNPETPAAPSLKSSVSPGIRRWSRWACRCSPANRTASRSSSPSGKPPPQRDCRWPCTSTAATVSTTRRRSPGTRTPIPDTRRSCRSNFFVHLATLIVEGVFARHPDVRFVFADGGYDILTPLMWRLDTFWLSMRDQTPWVDRYPSEYLADQVRFCSSALDGAADPADRALDGVHRQIRSGDVRLGVSALVHDRAAGRRRRGFQQRTAGKGAVAQRK